MSDLVEKAKTKLRIGAVEDLTYTEMDALLDYIAYLEEEVEEWQDRHEDLLSDIGGTSPR